MNYNMKVTSVTPSSKPGLAQVLLTCVDKGSMLGATKTLTLPQRFATSFTVGSTRTIQVNDNSLVPPTAAVAPVAPAPPVRPAPGVPGRPVPGAPVKK
jgi:hypothetical protein